MFPDEKTKKRLSAEEFASSLDWKEFEKLAGSAFEQFNFKVVFNYRLKTPRIEIDLLASQGDKAFAVDCKHWKRTVGGSTMLRVGEKQIERCNHLLSRRNLEMRTIIPVILTWHDEGLEILENGVPVVPIQRLGSFLLDWESFSKQLKVLE